MSFLGVDKHGDGADYKVVFVYQMCPYNNAGVGAEIYTRRVDAQKASTKCVEGATQKHDLLNKRGTLTFNN